MLNTNNALKLIGKIVAKRIIKLGDRYNWLTVISAGKIKTDSKMLGNIYRIIKDCKYSWF